MKMEKDIQNLAELEKKNKYKELFNIVKQDFKILNKIEREIEKKEKEKNPEKIKKRRAYYHQYRKKNKEVLKAKEKIYRKKHRDKVLKWSKTYRLKHSEKLRKYEKMYRKKHSKEIKKRDRERYKQKIMRNRDKIIWNTKK